MLWPCLFYWYPDSIQNPEPGTKEDLLRLRLNLFKSPVGPAFIISASKLEVESQDYIHPCLSPTLEATEREEISGSLGARSSLCGAPPCVFQDKKLITFSLHEFTLYHFSSLG